MQFLREASTPAARVEVFTQPRPKADIHRTEILQRASLRERSGCWRARNGGVCQELAAGIVGLSTVRCVALAAKQPPDAAASHHHEQNRQCDCSCKHCNYCCERKDVHDAILKCEKHAFPLDGKSPRPLTAGASWQSEVVRS